MSTSLVSLSAGQPIPFGGDRVAVVSPELATAFKPGDRLLVLQDSGALLRVPAEVQALVETAVGRAREAFSAMAAASMLQLLSHHVAMRLGKRAQQRQQLVDDIAQELGGD